MILFQRENVGGVRQGAGRPKKRYSESSARSKRKKVKEADSQELYEMTVSKIHRKGFRIESKAVEAILKDPSTAKAQVGTKIH